MNSMVKLLVACGTVFPFLTGCVVVIGDGGWGCGGPRVHTTASEELALDTAGVTALEVRTHNGTIDFQGQDAGPGSVTITKKAGGRTAEDAQEAMDAIEVFVEPAGAGITRMGWKWKVPKRTRWSGEVNFAIRAPRALRLDAETHNGAMDIAAVEGDVRAETHNGRIKVNSGRGALNARTHNGAITATYAGPRIALETHNGEIVADISRCAALTGDVTTHNGAVRLSVGGETSAAVRLQTNNGEVRTEVPLTDHEQSRGRLTGKLGSGSGRLDVTTHNGEIRLERS
jgi:hypothetical protein